MIKNELHALLVLNAINGLGPIRIRKLIECFGSADSCLQQSEVQLKTSNILPTEVVDNIIKFPKEKFLVDELKCMERFSVEAIDFNEERYPKILSEIHDAPVVLYFKGCTDVFNNPSIAIVGSRQASIYGISTALKMSSQFAEMGIVVVSGLARGIDRAAHDGVLKARGRTIAVLGSGLADIYPAEHLQLAERIAQDGLLISEFPMTTPPNAYNFPRRNRIVSGLSLGVIVVEASEKSGALITADCALEQGREVYAIPGKIDQATSKGVNNLIKQGAKLITGVEDVLEDLLPHLKINEGTFENRIQAHLDPEELKDLSDEERLVFKHISARPVHIDEINRLCQSSAVGVGSVLLRLELKHLVKQLPGKLFVR